VGSYYYLAAQLPYLIYGQAVPMSSATFRELARSALNVQDAAVLDCCTLDPDPAGEGKTGLAYAEMAPPVSSEFINRWREWERALRLNLARSRAQKVKREGLQAADAPEHPAGAAGAAKTALTLESPLEAELFLDKARWDAIEELQGIGAFSENAMYAYLLKLLLMERRAAFRAEEGFSEYKGLYTAILERAAGAAGAGFAPGQGAEMTEPGEPK
jgi:hypothetical protein